MTPKAVYRVRYRSSHWRGSKTKFYLAAGYAHAFARKLAAGNERYAPVAEVEIDRLPVVGTWEPVPSKRG